MNILPSRRERDASNEAEADEVIEGERDAAATAGGLRLQNKVTNLAIVAGVVTLAGLLLWRYYAAVYDRRKEAADPAHAVATVPASLPPLKAPSFPEPRQEAALPPMAPPAARAGAPAGAVGQPGGAASPAPARPLTPAQLRMKQRLESPLAFKLPDASSARVADTGAATDAAIAVAPPAAGEGPARASRQGAAPSAQAYLLADPGMTITQGSRIPCNVVEALDTTLPGLVTCIQAEDVRGADGKIVLLERGTKWVGRQGGGVAQGQRRVGIVWARGETPNHVLVDVDSGGTDWLGRPGIPGEVDNHFWDRFGAAILLSVVSDAGPYLAALHQGGGSNNTTIAFPNITGGAQQVMSDVLKTTLDIQPTLTAPEASRITIHVARDLDFRDVYALQARPTTIQ